MLKHSLFGSMKKINLELFLCSQVLVLLKYLTACPTNLGTALRASVHIKLPKLMKNKEKFNAIADKYYVQIRGIHGEHTETDDGVFDISNRRRLGRSEKDLVQDMINGVQALIAAENKL